MVAKLVDKDEIIRKNGAYKASISREKRVQVLRVTNPP
jgi:hypothetical protein